jgi:hypothetical protein
MHLLSPRNVAFRIGSVAGLLGGSAILAVALLDVRGPELVYAVYTVLVLGLTAVASWRFPSDRWQRFGIVFTGFMVASLVFYLYIVLIDNPSALSIPVLGHAWRLGVLAAVGAVLAGAAAFFTERSRRLPAHS